jgi:NAD(P)-dependent dehydrogenase (short-subunit alcohol dehydrogenase family)
MRSPHRNRFIVNVSAMEGKFNMKRKGRYHVHTNMAKASLNMMTLTMAREYKRDRIFITSVDPGWVSNQVPDKEIVPPLSMEDAAARVCDPVYEGKEAERPWTGVFLKDYQVIDW